MEDKLHALVAMNEALTLTLTITITITFTFNLALALTLRYAQQSRTT